MKIRNIVQARIRDLGWDLVRYREQNDAFKRLVRICEGLRCDCLIDVGANRGVFAAKLRKSGYSGLIISIEPLAEAHAKLEKRAERDPNWRVPPRMAVGAMERKAMINVSKNSESSSMLQMLSRHVIAAPHSKNIGVEEVDMIRLDSFINSNLPDEGHRFAIKIDAQGYEAEVIEGILDIIDRVQVIFLELSLVPLYQGAPLFLEMYQRIESLGFRCVSITPGFTDPKTYEMLQVDGMFARTESVKTEG